MIVVFIMSVFWIFVIVGEFFGCLVILGIIFGVLLVLLGLMVFVWGNFIGDFVVDVVVVRVG